MNNEEASSIPSEMPVKKVTSITVTKVENGYTIKTRYDNVKVAITKSEAFEIAKREMS